MSSGSVFLSGSIPGSSSEFNIVFEYLSPRPLTKTNLPPCTETPGTLFTADAISLSPAFFIAWIDKPSNTTLAFFWIFNTAVSEFLFAVVVTTTSSRAFEDASSTTSRLVIFPSETLTPVILFLSYPTNEISTV
ncbi:MAG: Uncharacterised protein [Flavobacteriales bacterium]|nr:MAG: Uncharacterised protein [Flavobacteriales bacterium]